jgi:hypothetical protein
MVHRLNNEFTEDKHTRYSWSKKTVRRDVRFERSDSALDSAPFSMLNVA